MFLNRFIYIYINYRIVTLIRKILIEVFINSYMNINLLKNIVSSIVGNSASGVVDILHDKKNVNEFIIAKKMNLTINQIRNILYKLSDEGLVSFVRKKDKKKGGWYTYYWTLNSGKSLIKFRDKLLKHTEQLSQQLALKKNGHYYHCKNCQIEHNEEQALNNNYTCLECGAVLEIKELSQEIIQLEKEISKIKNLLSSLDQEVNEISQKEGKARDRKIKAEQLKQKLARQKKAKARKKEKEKEKDSKQSKPKKKAIKSKVKKRPSKKKR